MTSVDAEDSEYWRVTSRAGVMIYLQQGPFDLGGNTVVNLFAEPKENFLIDPWGNDWKGILVYVDPENDSDVKITGTSGSTCSGMIFSPSSDCTIGGTEDSNWDCFAS